MLTSLGRVLHHPVVPLLLLVLANAVFYTLIASVIASAPGEGARLPTIGPAFAEINRIEGVTTIIHTSTIAIALAIVLGLGTGASAVSKNVHKKEISPPEYKSFEYVPSAGEIYEPMNMYIQDRDLRESIGLPY